VFWGSCSGRSVIGKETKNLTDYVHRNPHTRRMRQTNPSKNLSYQLHATTRGLDGMMIAPTFFLKGFSPIGTGDE
jgi:hypothetical protein